MKQKFLKPEHDQDLNAVDYWNIHKTWQDCFEGEKNIDFINDKTIVNHKSGKESFIIKGDFLHVTGHNDLNLPIDKKYTKFMLLSRIRFKSNHRAAITWVELKFLNAHIPYIRVGTDYFKIIQKPDRYSVSRTIIKGWKKEEIKQDHTANLLKSIPTFDDFIIEPDNMNHQQIIENCYNLYAPFVHEPSDNQVTEADIPTSIGLLRHIFGPQLMMGLHYLKIIYERPKQPLPILCLVSRERQTGKTTFLNWMHVIFGDNYCQINPEDLNSQFNSGYSTKNIIALDETVIDKSHAVEKLKSIATAKTISVNQKFVANYSIPFFGKVIICTNKEKDFMRIDEEEIRFWIRKVPQINSINTQIEEHLKAEIPAFLRFLKQLPAIETNRSRMVFTAEELKNDNLEDIQKESYSGLRKEIMMEIEHFFMQNDGIKEFYASAKDIKMRFFGTNNQITQSYIFKVLIDEMKLEQHGQKHYVPFGLDDIHKVKSRPFKFVNTDFQKDISINSNRFDISGSPPF
jgi:hypothetical protein